MLNTEQLLQLEAVSNQLKRYTIYDKSDRDPLFIVKDFHIEYITHYVCAGYTLLFIDMYYKNLKKSYTLSLEEIVSANFNIILSTLVKLCYTLEYEHNNNMETN